MQNDKSVFLQKRALRKKIRAELDAVEPSERSAKGIYLSGNLNSVPVIADAFTIAAFYPLPHEVNLVPFLEEILHSGRRLVLPRVRQGHGLEFLEITNLQLQLEPGAYRVMEPKVGMPPVSEKELDVLVTPGLAYTEDGRRLGHGGGYYDRLLERIEGRNIPTAGACFELQILDELPVEPTDRRVEWVTTEKRVIYCRTS